METVRVIQIPIVNDDVQERVEDFTVMIVAVDGIYPVNVIRSTAVIHISDNDCKLLNIILRLFFLCIFLYFNPFLTMTSLLIVLYIEAFVYKLLIEHMYN